MNNVDFKAHYHRNLPHIKPRGATLFVTFRLAGSIPRQVLSRWHTESQAHKRLLSNLDLESIAEFKRNALRRRFRDLESLLDRAQSSPDWLKENRISALVAENLRAGDGRQYRLDAFCIMPNHVHVVFKPLTTASGEYHALSVIMHSVKGQTAREANRLLQRTGSFWAHENFDHYICHKAEWGRIINCGPGNPLRAGFVLDWRDWKYNYLRIGGSG